MITPFDEEGRVDYPAVKGVVDHIISGGIDYIVLMGTTALMLIILGIVIAIMYKKERDAEAKPISF